MRHPFIALVGLLGGLFLASSALATHVTPATEAISANQPEYTLGDTAVIYGVGFAPNVSVIMEVKRLDGTVVKGDGTNTPGSDTVVTDGMGAFTYSYIIEGPPAAYAGIVTANARDAGTPLTVLATTTFIDGPQYLLQGCSKDRGKCTYDSSAGWAGGSSPINGWSASSLRGWFAGDDVPFRLRIGLRDIGSDGVYSHMTEQDNLSSGIFGVSSASGFYVGAGPSVPGYTEGALTKNCVVQATRLLGDVPNAAKPCIVTGPFYTGVDDDNDTRIDEDPVDGIDNDADGRIDEDPPRSGGSLSVRRIQYVWSVYFSAAEAGSRDDKWALYWKAHDDDGCSSFPGSSLHNQTTANGGQDVDEDHCGEHVGSGADLSITKTDAPDPVLVGQSLTYTLTVHNYGSNSASGVTVSDTLPTTVTFGSVTASQGTCSMSGGTVTCSLGPMANGATATVTIVVTPLAAGTLSNTAIVSSATSDPVPGNNTSGPVTTTVNPSANLSIIKSDAPDPVLVGQNVTYTITVANAGPSAATGVTMTDALPASVTFVSVTPGGPTCAQSLGTVTCGLGTMANGASTTITIVVTPTAAAVGTLSNTASVTSSVTDTVTSNNSSTTTTTVNASADLSITKTDAPDPVLAGQNLTYTITVANAGPSAATGVTVTDTLPAGVTFVSATPTQGTCSGTTTVTCALGTLNNGASATVTIVVKPTAAGTLSNSASVTSAVTDPNTANNSVGPVTTTVNPAADLSITKTDAPDPVLVGSNLTYTIVVANAGPSAATGVTMTDPLPAGVTFVSVTPGSPTCTQASGTVTCGLGTMASGAVTTTVSSLSADLSINKTDSPDPLLVGQNLTYTITVTNLGPNSATGVTVTDPLPAGATFVSSSSSQGSCSGTSTVTCSVGILGNGASAIVTIVVTPTAAAAGTLSNTASVSSGVSDPTSGNNSSTASTTVNASADLSITKTDAPDPVLAGQNL
ncbi:MAG: DUF11 domain-containing protein, partial [Nitrospirae bacterium]|nr:DUF11 domain-containing protein [Nitrospirota bacterium]